MTHLGSQNTIQIFLQRLLRHSAPGAFSPEEQRWYSIKSLTTLCRTRRSARIGTWEVALVPSGSGLHRWHYGWVNSWILRRCYATVWYTGSNAGYFTLRGAVQCRTCHQEGYSHTILYTTSHSICIVSTPSDPKEVWSFTFKRTSCCLFSDLRDQRVKGFAFYRNFRFRNESDKSKKRFHILLLMHACFLETNSRLLSMKHSSKQNASKLVRFKMHRQFCQEMLICHLTCNSWHISCGISEMRQCNSTPWHASCGYHGTTCRDWCIFKTRNRSCVL